MAQSLNDPEYLKRIAEMIKNPSLRDEMMRGSGRATVFIHALPGGMNLLTSFFSPSTTEQFQGDDPSTEEANERMSKILGANKATNSSSPNSDALPNPWAPQRNQVTSPAPVLQSPYGSGARAASGLQNPFFPFQMFSPSTPFREPTHNAPNAGSLYSAPRNPEPIEVKYNEELSTLLEMGFEDVELNKIALREAEGDLLRAVDYIEENRK
ncbi:hypothetical protein HDU91_005538 [Kappamyces sp. JEL0680]|nr:hypothetical protein HDU91_005538 [Kappamyces sp. JEL0680]